MKARLHVFDIFNYFCRLELAYLIIGNIKLLIKIDELSEILQQSLKLILRNVDWKLSVVAHPKARNDQSLP